MRTTHAHWRSRAAVAAASATALHIAILAVLHGPMPVVVPASDAHRVEMTFAPAVRPAPPPPHVDHEREPPTTAMPTPRPDEPAREAVAAVNEERARDDVGEASSASDVSTDVAPATPMAPAVPMRIARDDGDAHLRAAIRGTAEGPLPSIATLEAATGVKTVGPESDGARASRLAKAHLERDMSEHDVARGLADDWFRRRSNDLARLWNPNERELIDGGKQVQATELALRTAFNPLLWKEAAEIIAGDGAALAHSLTDLNRAHAIEQMMMPPHGKPLETDAERRARMRDTITTNKDAFATRVGLEVSVRHRPDGSVETIEVTASSGHRLLDEGAVDAVARALALDPADKAPASVARGQPFFTRWSLNVQWALNVPKCSALASGTGATSRMAAGDALPIGCGTSFGNNGVDVPFTVRKDRNVELISIDRL